MAKKVYVRVEAAALIAAMYNSYVHGFMVGVFDDFENGLPIVEGARGSDELDAAIRWAHAELVGSKPKKDGTVKIPPLSSWDMKRGK
jgi:hypothetical protein